MVYSTRREPGPWLAAGAPLSGEEVHGRLAAAKAPTGEPPRRYSVYVHVPFCASICSFCALYTRAVAPTADGVFDEYLEHVSASLARHPWAGSSVPPTTVHFGGGTPLFLGLDRFAALVRAIRDRFGTSPSCEWAVETTTSSVNTETMEALHDLGFRRIHLGIQTLDDATRRRVGRQEPGARAIERLESLQQRGFYTSIDLIIGFDGIGPDVVEQDLIRLYDAGVRMFSVCELRERGPIRLGVRDADAKQRTTYEIWRRIWEFMDGVALRPIHLGQFAQSQEDNLYFTHPARGEDCVAIGPYAHGNCGDVYYGNCLLPEYYDRLRHGRAPVQSGLEYAPSARAVRALERELLAHRLSDGTLELVARAFPGGFPELLMRWRESGLMESTADGQALTIDGSWFVGNMVYETRALAEHLLAAEA